MVSNSEKTKAAIPSAAFLIVIRQVFPLDQEEIKVGRGSENHLVIDDPSVSRAHIAIKASAGVFELQDLDSTGGTYINGQQVAQRALSSGDIISLAGVTMLYVEESPRPLDTSRLRLLHR